MALHVRRCRNPDANKIKLPPSGQRSSQITLPDLCSTVAPKSYYAPHLALQKYEVSLDAIDVLHTYIVYKVRASSYLSVAMFLLSPSIILRIRFSSATLPQIDGVNDLRRTAAGHD
jgi:hypothetical protein